MPNDGIVVGGDYTVQAGGNVCLQASGDCLYLNAISPDDVQGGYLAANADQAMTLSCGEGVIALSKSEAGQTQIGLVASAGGSVLQAAGPAAAPSQVALEPTKITLSQGPIVGGQQIVMEPGKIVLTVGPPGVGAQVQLALDGITIQYAQWSLAIKAAGITLTVGPSTLTVAPDKIGLNGMMIDIEGITQTVLKGLATQINGTATVQVQGGLITLG